MNKPLRTRNPKPEPEPTSDCKAGDELPRKLLQSISGQSVNSARHPPDRKNFDTIAKEILFGPVTITENGRKITVPAIEAVLRVLLEKSQEADLHAIDMLMKLMPNAQAAIDAEQEHEAEARARAQEEEVDMMIRAVLAKRLLCLPIAQYRPRSPRGGGAACNHRLMTSYPRPRRRG